MHRECTGEEAAEGRGPLASSRATETLEARSADRKKGNLMAKHKKTERRKELDRRRKRREERKKLKAKGLSPQ
jgi:hypothetical protein